VLRVIVHGDVAAYHWCCAKRAELCAFTSKETQSACRYKIVKQLGDGTYGSVWKGMNHQTNEVVWESSLTVSIVVDSATMIFPPLAHDTLCIDTIVSKRSQFCLSEVVSSL
jgi:serine/threonine protein kinase